MVSGEFRRVADDYEITTSMLRREYAGKSGVITHLTSMVFNDPTLEEWEEEDKHSLIIECITRVY